MHCIKSVYALPIFTLLASLVCFSSCGQNPQKGDQLAAGNSGKDRVSLVLNESQKSVDVNIDGVFFTSYIFPDSLEKPVLYPIMTAQGTPITRGFPIAPRSGERFDHPHHIGLWFNYGDVNGLDFWNNSAAIPASEKSKYGHIVHKSIKSISSGNEEGRLEVELEWLNEAGEKLLTENTTFIFSGNEGKRVIDRISKLTAGDKEVSFTDNKEGMLGLRVARELEHPSEKPELFTDAAGKVTDVPTMNNEGVTGMYRSSEGIEGNEVWGTRGNWVSLSGKIKDEHISVVILDNPSNPGFPTYWHARGYGLFAANPLGQKALSGGKEELNFKLKANEAVTFKYRISVLSGDRVEDSIIREEYLKWVK
ncbi:MAG: hypothetical protein ACI8YP_002043 [Algoriphagus sp.]|jgi:hypothetical protein